MIFPALRRTGGLAGWLQQELCRPYWNHGHVAVDPGVRGGEPVIAGTRIPYDEVAALFRDGAGAEEVDEFFPQVSPAAARDAYDFASYVDSYVQSPERAA